MKRMNKSSEESGISVELDNGNIGFTPERKKITWIVHVTVIFYALCYWLQLGVIPYLTRKLGVDAKMYGYLQSVFAFVQLCGGPLFGRFGDLCGGKYALILAYFGCFMSYGLLAVASSIPVLFLSRLPSCLMHSMQGSQMIITDITSSEERAGGIGRLGVFYGIGMVVGPLLGGFITDHFDEQTAAATSAFGSVFCVVLILLLIPADTKKYSVNKDEKDDSKLQEAGSVLDITKYLAIFQVKNFKYLFTLKIISGIPFGIFQAMFSLMAMEYFQLAAKQNGMVLSYVGITGMLVQGFGINFLTKRYSDAELVKYAIMTITIAYLFLIFASNIYFFLVVLFPLTCGGSVFAVVVTSIITKTVPTEDTGAALGLSMATHSMIRTVSPTIGGLLYSYFGFPVFGVLGFIVNSLLAVYLISYGRRDL